MLFLLLFTGLDKEFTTLHKFPNPVKDPERFRRWIYAIGGDILGLDNQYIYKYKNVCHRHFDTKYHTWTNTLIIDAIPTLNLPGLLSQKCRVPMSDITLKISSSQNIVGGEMSQPSTSRGIPMDVEHINFAEQSSVKRKLNSLKTKNYTIKMAPKKDKGILPDECKQTADALLFFDNLFDSMNGSYFSVKNRSGKPLLGAVTPKSEHSQFWKESKKILKSMKFVTKDGKEASVPSLTNWLRTLDNADNLKEVLFNEYNIKSFYMRHFNQDPLENYFGCIRSHGCRNISPTPSGFEAAFTSLLINNMSSNHSPGSNCEEDYCKVFQSMNTLLNDKEIEKVAEVNMDVNYEDLFINIEDFENKKRDVKVIAQLNFVTGFILRQAKKRIFKNCEHCRKILFDNQHGNEYLRRREYSENRLSLTYPSDSLLRFFSGIQDIVTNLIENKSDKLHIKEYIKTILSASLDFNFINCKIHRVELLEFLFEECCNFFIRNWCKNINKLLNGSITDYNKNDPIKVRAFDYHNKRINRKKRKYN